MKASSESGECASLISTGCFSVFEAVCLPGMGGCGPFLAVVLRATVARSGCLVRAAPQRLSQFVAVRSGEVRERTCAALGVARRWAKLIFARGRLAYRRPLDNRLDGLGSGGSSGFDDGQGGSSGREVEEAEEV